MLAEELDNINNNYIILSESIKNSIIQDSYFYKLTYSNDYTILNGVYCKFDLNVQDIDDDKIMFDNKNNNNALMINKIILLENYILNLIPNNKNKIYKIKELLVNNFFKITKNDSIDNNNNFGLENFILKISGIWETKENIGLTFKFFLINKIYNFYPSVEKKDNII